MAQQPIELILLRQLATSLVVPLFIVDQQGDLIFLNEAAERLLGVRLEELGDLPFETWTTAFRPKAIDGSIVPADELPLVRAIVDRRPAHGPLRITGSDGVDRTIEITAFPLEGGGGRLIGGVAMFWETEPA
jgi:PAS domain S-box-containing protein